MTTNREGAGMPNGYVQNHEPLYQWVLKFLSDNVSSQARILEVGSVPCNLTSRLNKQWETIGIDINPDRAADVIDRHNLDVRQCDIETKRLPIADNSVDVVLFTEVFEHLRINPVFTLRELRRVIDDSGIMLLTTPNLYYLKNVYDFARGRGAIPSGYGEWQKLETLGHMGHVREYAPSELREWLTNTGFNVSSHEFRTFGSPETVRDHLVALVSRIIPWIRRNQIVVATPG